MADNIDFSRYAGRITFPRTPDDLLSTSQCPACFTELASTVCESCGLDLSHPAASELHDASVATSAALDKRLAIIGRIRYDTTQAAEAQATELQAASAKVAEAQAHEAHSAAALAATPAAAIPAPVAPETAASVTPSTAAVKPAPPAPEQSAPTQLTPPAPVGPGPFTAPPAEKRRKHSTVQVIILSVGVSLLSIAAIFFLVYAFVFYGVTWRIIIVAAFTSAAIAGATLLRRRRIPAAAEGVAVVAAIIVYGDAFALRANDYFGLASSDVSIYWGIVLIVTSAAFILWHRLTGIRTPSIVGFGAFAPGVGILVGGLTKDVDLGSHAFFIAASIAVAGLVHLIALPGLTSTPKPGSKRTPERIIILGMTVIALIVGFIIAFGVNPRSDWDGTIAALVLAAIAATHLWAMKPASVPQPIVVFGHIFASAGAIFASSAVGIAALRIGIVEFMTLAPVIAAAVVALSLEAIAVRGALAWRKFSITAAWSAAGVFALALLVPVLTLVSSNLLRAVKGFTSTWLLEPSETMSVLVDTDGWSVLSLTIVGVLATASWSATKTLHRRGPLVAWLGAATLIAAVAATSIVWVTVAGWLVLATVAVLILSAPSLRTKILPAYRAPIAAAAITTMTFGYMLSWASLSTWWVGSLVIIILLMVSRLIVRSSAAKASLLAIATTLAFIASNAVAHHITHGAFHLPEIDRINGLRFVSIVAAVLLTLSAVPLGKWFTRADRRVMFWLGGSTAVLATLTLIIWVDGLGDLGRSLLLLPEHASSFVVALIVLAGFWMWAALRTEPNLRPERITASILIAPALYFAVMALTNLLVLPDFALTIAPMVSALLAAAASLTIATVRPANATRWALDVGVVLVGLPSVFVAIFGGAQFAWLVLVIAAVTVLLLAIDRDGLFSSSSWRRQLGWVALALATVGMWWKLSDNNVTDLEPYVLPLTGALLLIAFLLEYVSTKHSEDQPARRSKAAPIIALGGLVVSVLPLAANASSSTDLRAGIIAAVSVALLLSGSYLRGAATAQRWWDSAALAGAIGVVVVMIGRAVYLPVTDTSRDAWIVGGFLCLMLAAYGQTLPREPRTGRVRAIGSQWLGVFSMAVVLLLQIPAFHELHRGPLRVIGVVALFSAVHVLALLLERAPFTRLVGWFAIGFAALTAFFGTVVDAIYEPEYTTLPIAAALLITGTMHMRANATARSWPWIAPGVSMLLLPSLIETINDQNLWRVVGLGLVGIVVIIIGAVRKLQAPFLIGVVIVLIHAIATFMPQLRATYLAVPWWLWLAIGGILLIVLAIRYERRIRDLKNVITKLTELR